MAFAGLQPAAFARSHKVRHTRPQIDRYASIVMDADTGTILSQTNPDKQLHPASLTKILTLLILFQALDSGEINLRDRITVSNHAASMEPSKLGVPPGASIKVQDAIYAIVTKSANDMAVAIAERLAGSESNFASLMTARARSLGMTNSYFVNASGLHDPRQVSSARDMAILARYVIKNYPGYYRYYSTGSFTYDGHTYANHNRLMETYAGMDGMKTGYVGASGFNLVASAVRNHHRLIGVVFGGKSTSSRNAQMASLLDRGWTQVDDVRIASATPAAKVPLQRQSAQQQVASLLPSDMEEPSSAPVPQHKPAFLVALNSLSKVSPASGTSRQPAVKLASLGPVLDPSQFEGIVGEGDIDPAEARRIQTGLVAVSAIKSSGLKSPRLLTAPAADNSWAIQLGAYSSRAATDDAIHKSMQKLPASLTGNPVIAPLKMKDGWVFRARIGGYTREQAFSACGRLSSECIPVAPRND